MTLDLTCPYCGFSKKVLKEKIPSHVREATCPRCQQRFEILAQAARPESGTGRSQTGGRRQDTGEVHGQGIPRENSPWERRGELGLWPAIYQNIKAVLFSPKRFFSNLSTSVGFGESLAFGLLSGSIGGMFSIHWNTLMGSWAWHSMVDAFIGSFAFGFGFLLLFFFVPIGVLIGLFITTVICHLFLLLFRGTTHGFEATFRVVCYAQAVQLLAFIPFMLVPVIGPLVIPFWQVITYIIGMKEIHETSYLKVIFAFLTPFAILVLLGICVVILILFLTGQQRVGPLWP